MDKLLKCGTPMKSGKVSPEAYVANEKIYMVGSTIKMNISDRCNMKDFDCGEEACPYSMVAGKLVPLLF